MKEEIQVMKDRKVWDLVVKPQNAKVIGNRWVFSVKKNSDGQVIRYKSRLVAQGFLQCKGQSYDETFSPVVNFSLVRLFFSVLVAYMKWSHRQLDIKCAYLYAPLSDTVYMRQPQGFIDPKKPHYVCRLKKAIYGLHQSGREWFYEISSKLLNVGFEEISWANCVFTYRKHVMLLLYVDDIVIFGKTEGHINHVIQILNSYFDLKDLGKTRKLLGVEIEESDDRIFIHQKEYINSV